MDDIFVSGTKQQPRGRDDKADGENHKRKKEKAKSQDDGEQEENRCQLRQSTNSEQIKVLGEKREIKGKKIKNDKAVL